MSLSAAGYLHIIQQMKELIEAAGKKSYTLVMGRPNSAKLANFPEVNLNCRNCNLFSFNFHLEYLNRIFFLDSVKSLFMFRVPKLLCWIARIFWVLLSLLSRQC